jgi:hypothetical protein
MNTPTMIVHFELKTPFESCNLSSLIKKNRDFIYRKLLFVEYYPFSIQTVA